jgi:hypothetical protein
MTLSPTGVDLSNKGRFTYKTVDLSVGPFTLERSYIGGHSIDGSAQFGLNWTHNYSIYVVEKNLAKSQGVYVVIGRATVHFSFNTYGCWHNDCEGSTLTLVGGAFVYTDPQGNVYTFNSSVNAFPPYSGLRNQRIARIDYADGHVLTYTYSGAQLRQIASNYGYSLVFEYGASGYISRACGYNRAVTAVTTASTCAGAALAVSYGYGPHLTSVVDAIGQTWGYDYYQNANARMSCVRQVNSSACLIANNHAATGGQTVQQTTPDGAVWNIYIDGVDPDNPQQPGQLPVLSGGGFTGPEGIEAYAQFGAGLLDYYTENGRSTYMQYDGFNLARVYHPEGNNVSYDWRAGEKVYEAWEGKPGSGLATISKGLGFPDWLAAECVAAPPRKLCNKPIWSKDYKGNQIDYTYDGTHGGVLTETGPAVNGVRPQVRYEYAARRAWVSNGGGYAQENVPIYLPVKKSFCMTGAASGAGCAIAGDEVVTTFDYGPDSGPNNLRLRAETVTAGGVSRRTCYGYDWLGNKISTTRPNGLCQ